MLAFPQAMQPGLSTLGPQWNAARSTHHRIAWLARESSKPGRGTDRALDRAGQRRLVARTPAGRRRHASQAKLLKAFAEVTGIRAEPTHVDSHRWLYAKTEQPLGKTHLWDAKTGWACAATGAWATAWKTRLCPVWSWRWPRLAPSA